MKSIWHQDFIQDTTKQRLFVSFNGQASVVDTDVKITSMNNKSRWCYIADLIALEQKLETAIAKIQAWAEAFEKGGHGALAVEFRNALKEIGE